MRIINLPSARAVAAAAAADGGGGGGGAAADVGGLIPTFFTQSRHATMHVLDWGKKIRISPNPDSITSKPTKLKVVCS